MFQTNSSDVLNGSTVDIGEYFYSVVHLFDYPHFCWPHGTVIWISLFSYWNHKINKNISEF